LSYKFSIITPSFNQGRFIRDTIESVLAQNIDGIEHIVVDGASTDNTIEILKEYPHLKWVSEKDSGPADAITKGIKMSSGHIVGWVNSDDYLVNNVLKDVYEKFNVLNSEILVGDMILIDLEGNIIYESKNHDIYNREYLVKVDSDIIKQPSTFFTRELFDKVGGFDPSLKLVWDYDLFVKMFSAAEPVMLHKFLSYQRIYDETLTRSSLRRQAVEIFRISRRHGAKITDKINVLVLKRFLIPSTKSDKPSVILKLIRSIKKLLKIK
jgi:glycosyltransferase involved in cell wall biosynthesis